MIVMPRVDSGGRVIAVVDAGLQIRIGHVRAEARGGGRLGPLMRSLAVIALLLGGTSSALAQNPPPTNGYPPPPPGTSGTPATYGPPAPGIIPGAPGPVYSHHYRHWWPQDQYHWRWGYWCEGGRGRQMKCGVPR